MDVLIIDNILLVIHMELADLDLCMLSYTCHFYANNHASLQPIIDSFLDIEHFAHQMDQLLEVNYLHSKEEYCNNNY